MLYIEMPPTFAIGDHAQSATVLVIEPADRRHIIHTELDVDVRFLSAATQAKSREAPIPTTY